MFKEWMKPNYCPTCRTHKYTQHHANIDDHFCMNCAEWTGGSQMTHRLQRVRMMREARMQWDELERGNCREN